MRTGRQGKLRLSRRLTMPLHGLMQRSRYALRSALARLRGVRRSSWLKIGAGAGMLAALAGGLALGHESPQRHRRSADNHARSAAVMSDVAHPVVHAASAAAPEGKEDF